ncbi:MAG: hypothetical protein QM765_07690 [Myxococcales bacterium]
MSKTSTEEFQRRAGQLIASAAWPDHRRIYERDLRSLARREINTFDALARALPRLKGSVATTAVQLAKEFGRAKAVPVLLPLLEWGSASVLAELGGARACTGCIAVLNGDGPLQARVAAAYALTFMHDDRAASALLHCVSDQADDPGVRGQAAEGLAELFEFHKQHPLYRKAARTALKGLANPSPVVRFWCAFALGKMRHRPALPVLRRVAKSDRAVCPGMWRVCDEASDAIAWIEGRQAPDRTPGKDDVEVRRHFQIVEEPRGRSYRELLEKTRCLYTSFGLVEHRNMPLSAEGRAVLKRLAPFLISEDPAKKWPGTETYMPTATVRRYLLSPNSEAVLMESARGLFDWRQPDLPEDLHLLRPDGSVLLASVAHEREAFIEATDGDAKYLGKAVQLAKKRQGGRHL